MTTMGRKKLFLIDGSAFAYKMRHEFLKQPLRNTKGLNTTLLFMFTDLFFAILEEERPEYLAVFWDSPLPSFRHEIYAPYKNTGERLPLEILEQFFLLEKMVHGFNIPWIQVKHQEAEDVIASYVEQAQLIKDLDVFIVSGEKRLLQLLNSKVFLYQRKGLVSEIWDGEKVKETYGVEATQMKDLLALAGDSSESLPGVAEIGERSVLFLLEEYQTLENALLQAKTIKRKTLRENLLKNPEQIELSQKLTL
jgi:DNA polymerase-1